MSSSDKQNRLAGDGYNDIWEYKTIENESNGCYDDGKANTLPIDLHGLTIHDIADRHVENFMETIEHELVNKWMKTFMEKSAVVINENQMQMNELQRKHEREHSEFENELLKLSEEIKANLAELNDFVDND